MSNAAARLNARVAAVRKRTGPGSLQEVAVLHSASPSRPMLSSKTKRDEVTRRKTDKLRRRLKDAEAKNKELVAVAQKVNSQLLEAETRHASQMRAPVVDREPISCAANDPSVHRSRALVRRAERLNHQLQLHVSVHGLVISNLALKRRA